MLTGREQRCKFQDILSKAIGIKIVQGSGIGPSLYIIMESDLYPKSSDIKLMKYADDTNLLVPEISNCTLTEEFEHIKDWATANKMVICLILKNSFSTGHTQVDPICLQLLITSSKLKLLGFLELCFLLVT